MEHRRLLAFDLVQAFATTDTPFFLAGTNYTAATLTEAPQQIALRFSAGVKVDPTSIAGAITVTRSNGLGDAFANSNDIVITPGYIGVDDAPNDNQVIIRFAETLPNDSYRITIGASLKTVAEGSAPVQMFRDGGSFNLNFRLDLGGQVTSVVPQPVIRAKTITFSALPQDGDLLEVAIRGGKRVFEFDGNGSVQSGNTAISITGKTTANLATDVAAAINALATVTGFTNELASASAAGTTASVSGVNFTPVVKFTRGGTVPASSPVRVGDGSLTQLKSKVVVYFNAADPLDASTVVPAAFKLYTLDSTTGSDTATIDSPTSVSYDAASASAVLTFAADLPADKLYRLQIGQSDVTPKTAVTETDNANSTFTAAKDLGSLSGAALERISVKVTGAIDATSNIVTPAGNLSFPRPTGDGTEPGHRDIPAESHLDYGGMTPGQIRVQAYNFSDYYGNDVQGNQLTNVITETQKQRAREIFDIYSRYTGIRFVETANQGITVITGDLRAFSPALIREPVAGLGSFRSFAAMDSADDWGESEYGGYWFEVAIHEIGHALGLGHAYDIPAIMGDHYGPRLDLDAEPVWPGNYDRVHLDVLYPRAGTDIDLYKFNVTTAGQLTAQTFVSRPGQPVTSKLDSVLTLYREVAGKREIVARNDDYFGRDSFIGLDLDVGTYYIAVTSTGNTNFNPEISDSGYGGRTEGDYELRVDFSPAASVTSPIKDATATFLDGDRDGKAGGEYKFWFQTASSANTLFIDKAAATRNATITSGSITITAVDVTGLAVGMLVKGFGIADNTTISAIGTNTITLSRAAISTNTTASLTFCDGSVSFPFAAIDDALAAVTSSTTIIRIVGNTGNAASAADDRPYLIGTDPYDRVLEDGETFVVPKDVTVMIDAGATLKLRAANIDVGSSSSLVDRSGAVLQVLGTPSAKVFFTSFHDDARGGDSDRFGPAVEGGQWGGLVFRGDSDFKKDRVLGTLGGAQNNDRVFLNSVSNASLRYGGGPVLVDSFQQNFAPIHLESTRPSLVFNDVTDSAGAPISADPNSFEDTAGRVGPEIRGNRLVDNSINGIFVRIRTELGKTIDKLNVPARFRNTDAPYVLTENLLIDGGAGGYIEIDDGNPATNDVFTRDAGRLQVDPGVVIKLWRSRIELDRGRAQFIAEGMPNNRVVFTTLADNRFGGGGTFDTNGANLDVRMAGDWGGIIVNAGAKASIDQAYIAFGGGETPIEGRFDNFSVVETHQGDLRLANSRIENNAASVASSDRDGRGRNDASTIFVRGAQPIIAGNDFRSNAGAMVSINANALVETENPDPGRSTGAIDRFTGYDDNRGPLVRANTTSYAAGSGAIAGMRVRGEEITVESVWDDTDVVHVLQDEIIVQNFHTATGVRLQSSPNASLVVKLQGTNAGFTAAGYGLDIDDRIGGTVQVVGFPTKPVILTSLKDDSVGASYDPLGRLVTDTNGDGTTTTAAAGDWRSLRFMPLSNDRNVAVVNEAEAAYLGSSLIDNGRIMAAQVLGVLAPNFATGTNSWESAQEKTGDENRRLGFEVHGAIALDNPGDNDIYSFQGYSGSEVWFDIDKTSPGLDAMLELLDAAGNVIARSADAQTDNALTTGVVGAASPLTKDAWRGGDYYGTNPRDPGMRVILPTRAGYPLGSLTQYYVRVRSQAAYSPTTTQNAYEAGLTATTAAALATGASKGEYELRIRLRQRDEKPGSTVRSADIRFPTTGIDVLGLPHNSQVLGETAEANVDANNVWTSAQKVGNLLAIDRNTISVGGELSSATDVDWFQFDLDVPQIQSIAGVNGGGKTWSMVFDLDYADGIRGDLTISVFDSAGKLIYVGRDSDVAADQPGAGQGNDFDDLSRGSVGKLDPFIGPIQMPATAGRYYVAVSSNEQLPLALNATFRSDAANAQIRLEPVNSLDRIVEDHIGSIGYKDSAGQQIDPKTGPLIGTTLWGTGLTPTEAASVPPITSTTTTTFALAHANVTPDSVNATISYNDPLFGTTTRWTITTDTSTGVVTIAPLGAVITFAEPVAMLVRGPAGRVEVTWNVAVDPADVQLDEVKYLATGVNPLSAHITPFTLADVTLFLSTGTGLYTHDAVSGSRETTVNATAYAGLTIGDIDMRPDGKLYAYAGVNGSPTTVGQLMELNSGTGAAIAISPDAIPNAVPQDPPNFQTTSDTVTAMTFGRTNPGEYRDLWLVVQSGGQSKLYLAADGGSAGSDEDAAADATANQGPDSEFGYWGRIGIDLNKDGDYRDPGERPLVTGLQFVNDASGILYGVTSDGKLLTIRRGTKLEDVAKDFDAPAEVVADYGPDLAKVGATGFTALATAPQNLYDGALRGKFFALTNTGRLALLNPTGTLTTSMDGELGLLSHTATTGGFLTVEGTTVATTLAGSRTGVTVLTAGSTTVDNKNVTGVETSELFPGNRMLVFGTGIAENTLLERLESGDTIRLSQNATATTTFTQLDPLTFIYVSVEREVTTVIGPNADTIATDTASLSQGMIAISANLPTGTLIKEVVAPAVPGAAASIILTQKPTDAGPTTIRFIRPDVAVSARTQLGSKFVTVPTSSATALRDGMQVFGKGVPLDTRIRQISGTTVELNYEVNETSEANLLAFVDGRSVTVPTGARDLTTNMLVVDPQGGQQTVRGSTTIAERLDDSTIVLSKPALQSRLRENMRFIAPSVIDRTGTANGNTVTIDTSGLVDGGASGGMYVLGDNIPPGTRIDTVATPSGTITLTLPVTVNGQVSLTFYKDTNGDVIEGVATANLSFDDLVFSDAVPYNTWVTNFTPTTLTLSKPTTRAVPSTEFAVLRPDVPPRPAQLFSAGRDNPPYADLNASGLRAGMMVIGDGVPVGTFITSRGPARIILSEDVPRQPSELRFLTPNESSAGVPTLFSTVVTGLDSTVDLSVGMLVFGRGIPNNTRIVGKTADSITLDKEATGGDGTASVQLGFFRDGSIVSGLSTTSDLRIGMTVTGAGLRDGTQIKAINADLREITLTIGALPEVRSSNQLTFGTGSETPASPPIFDVIIGGLQSTAVVNAMLTSDSPQRVLVFGDGVADGTTVARVRDNTSLVLSRPFTGDAGDIPNLAFIAESKLTRPDVVLQGEITAGSRQITGLASTRGLRLGMLVLHPSLPFNTRILEIDSASAITLTKDPTASDDSALIDFISTATTEYLADWNDVDDGFSPVLAAGATGIAFSPLDINLWHTTERRGDGKLDSVVTPDPGHGINTAPDNSRNPPLSSTGGGTSMYFGLETWKVSETAYRIYTGELGQYGVTAPEWQRELTTNTGRGDTYDLPGGAYGSLTTNPFSLAGYIYTNKPTLYFNYWLDTEDASGTVNTMRDSARVLISKDQGLTWELVATNNHTRSTTSELPGFPSVSSAISYDTRQHVQELFDSSKTTGWRQARIDLGKYAGEADLRLRFDFHTAGEFDPTVPDPSGAVLGPAGTTGNFTNSERGQRNNFEGFYIDDIIVGFAERGEMVTGAIADQAAFFDVGTPGPGGLVPAQYLVGPYQLEMRRGTEYAENISGLNGDIAFTQTFDTDDDLVRSLGLLGDENLPREQGQFLIEGNWIANAKTYGISIDAGQRDPDTGAPASGSPRKFSVLNNSRLAPGAVVVNNIISSSGTAGILFSGDPNAGNGPLAAVPYGRIVNNTIYGGATQAGVGIQVTENAAPTLLNNVFSGLTTAIDVDSTSVNDGFGNLRTVIGTSAFHNVGTQVTGTTANQSLTLSSNPFVAAQFANFYLAEGTAAIDSALNTLQDRTEYAVVTSQLGISVSPIVAPSRDIYGQLRGDDPKQASTPGLGSDIFKDRGAVDRVDFASPFRTLVIPADTVRTVAVVRDDLENSLTASGAAGRGITRLEMRLSDRGVGIDPATVRPEAFTLLRGTTSLILGRDYLYSFDPTKNVVTFESVTVFAPDSYKLTATSQKAGAQAGLLTDLANNTLRPNNDDGTLTFAITLSDVPDSPADLTAVSGNTTVSLSWTAPAANGSPITSYVIEYSTTGIGGWTNFARPGSDTPTSTSTNVTGLTNGNGYWFRVAAVNALGQGPWSDVTGPVTPLSVPTLTLAADTGLPGDGITNNGQINVGNLDAGTTWQYRTNGGTWVDGIGTFFTLTAGSYAISSIQVRQSATGNVSGTGSNTAAITVDLAAAAPTPTLASDTGASPTDGITNNGIVNVAGIETGATWQYSTDNGSLWNNGTGTSFTLSAGTYAAGSIRVKQTDLAGNNSTEGSIAAAITVDTTKPVPPSFALAADTGASSTDGGTSNGRVNVTGIVANATWEFSTNGGTSWTAGSNGFFMLPEGTYNPGRVQVRQISLAGNASDAVSNAAAITVDQTALAPTPTLASDTGASPSDGITNNGLVNVAGIETGATWQYSTNNGGSWTTGTSSSFTLPAGTYAAGTIRVKQTDLAGNTSAEGAILTAITVDTSIPATPSLALAADTGASNADGVTSNGRMNVTGIVANATWEFSTDGGATWSAGSNGFFTLSAGFYAAGRVQVRQTSLAGVQSNLRATLNAITVDQSVAAPTPSLASDTGSSPTDGITNNGLINVAGIEPGATWQFSVNSGGSWTTGTSSAFTLPAGTYSAGTLRVKQTDLAGNDSTEGSLARTLTIDTVQPAAPSLALAADTGANPFDGVTSNGLVNVAGIEPGAMWQYSTNNGGSWTNGAGGSFVLPAGTYPADSIRVRQADVAGNVSGESSIGTPITVESSPPAAPVAALASDTGASSFDGVTSNGRVNVTGIAPNATWEFSTNGGATWSVGVNDFFTLPAGTYSANSIQVRQTSLAGLPSGTRSIPTVITVDQAAASPTPTLAVDTGASPSDGVTSNGLVNVAGIEPGATWQYSTNNGGSWTNGAGGSFVLPAGTYAAGSVRVRQTDVAGNTSGEGLAPQVTIDSNGPAIVGFGTTMAAGTYGPGTPVTITATTNEPVQAGSAIAVTLNTGAVVTLRADVAGTILSGIYQIAVGENTSQLAIVASGAGSVTDIAGNPLTSIAGLPTPIPLGIAVDGAIRLITPTGFSSNAALIPDRRVAVTSIPITFNTPVTGLTLASFQLRLNGRSVSLRGARLTGSGANYTLTLPSRLTNSQGIYTLRIIAANIKAVSNGAAMEQDQFIYWGKGRSVGFTVARTTTTRTTTVRR